MAGADSMTVKKDWFENRTWHSSYEIDTGFLLGHAVERVGDIALDGVIEGKPSSLDVTTLKKEPVEVILVITLGDILVRSQAIHRDKLL